MGWSGEKEETKEEEKLVARDARLGLGASARPPDEKQRGSKEDIKKRKEEWDKKASEKLKKQLLNDGDFVWLRDVANAGKRALVVCTRGVPGLDRIRVRLELSGKSIEIKRTDAVLLSEEDLKAEPYHPADPVNTDTVTNQFFGLKKNEEDNKDSERKERNDRSEREGKETREDRDKRERLRDSKRERDGERGDGERSRKNDKKDLNHKNDYDNYENNKSSGDRDVSSSGKDRRSAHDNNGTDDGSYSNNNNRNNNNNNSSSSSSGSKNNNSNNNSTSKSNNSSSSGSGSTWLVTGIRVRVVSKRCAGYLEKGSVVDVPSARVATVRLDGGKVEYN